MKSILDPSFRYTPSVQTDVRKTFARIRRELREREQSRSEREVDGKLTVLAMHRHPLRTTVAGSALPSTSTVSKPMRNISSASIVCAVRKSRLASDSPSADTYLRRPPG